MKTPNFTILLFIAFAIFISCKEQNSNIIQFSASHNDTCVLVKYKYDTSTERSNSQVSINIIDNTIDDTCIIKSFKVPPKFTGNIFYIKD